MGQHLLVEHEGHGKIKEIGLEEKVRVGEKHERLVPRGDASTLQLIVFGPISEDISCLVNTQIWLFRLFFVTLFDLCRQQATTLIKHPSDFEARTSIHM